MTKLLSTILKINGTRKKCITIQGGFDEIILRDDTATLNSIFKSNGRTISLAEMHQFEEYRQYAIALKQVNSSTSKLDYFIKD